MNPFENCVYTIIHSEKIDEMIRVKESIFVENRVWRKAFEFFEEAKKKRQVLYLVFAPSESTKYLYAYATISNIEILKNKNSTKVTFSNLRKFSNANIRKTKLVKLNGTHVDENFIRPYMLCRTSSILKFLEKEPASTNVAKVEPMEKFVEGAKNEVLSNKYERNKKAREACIKYYGFTCSVCGFDFEKNYGKIGKGFIHVHHELDISAVGKEYIVDPIKDLKPVCPNCHAMLHQKKPAYSIKELKKIMKTK